MILNNLNSLEKKLGCKVEITRDGESGHFVYMRGNLCRTEDKVYYVDGMISGSSLCSSKDSYPASYIFSRGDLFTITIGDISRDYFIPELKYSESDTKDNFNMAKRKSRLCTYVKEIKKEEESDEFVYIGPSHREILQEQKNELLKRLKELGKTQTWLAEQLGISRQAVSEFLRREPKYLSDTIYRYLKLLDE
ncbi:MAG TPA: helix-turn-helix transcriptional regulator [Nanoarchaeota archaeon]|nr:MAG: hypothetical protein QT09_C0011G0024 [archaeon GW2011_AR18]HIH25305.1 helix-turn-helix transcriptional regulator [Nanoarchaeota archaeon]